MSEAETGAREDDRASTGDGGDRTGDDDAYVHRPSGEPPRKRPVADRSFGWRGWVLVAALVVAFLVIPWALIALPPVQSGVSALGLSLRDTYLVVPLVPAFALGALGVWTALRARQE